MPLRGYPKILHGLSKQAVLPISCPYGTGLADDDAAVPGAKRCASSRLKMSTHVSASRRSDVKFIQNSAGLQD
ncbi:MAG: hypothetical protein LBC18_06750, partial [Opitutaceae bacterium]|nr:hypothetical protein [Opitutaceae bacterium]